MNIFRHFSHKFLDIRQYACEISVQFDEKSYCASAAQSLCGVASNKKNKDVVTVPEATTSYMTYNETGKVKGLDNFKIRQALNLATDRKGIVEAAVDTGSVPDRSNGC